MIKLTEDEPKKEPVQEPEFIEPKMTVEKPDNTVKKKSKLTMIILIVLFMIIIVGLFMYYNHQKNKDGNNA